MATKRCPYCHEALPNGSRPKANGKRRAWCQAMDGPAVIEYKEWAQPRWYDPMTRRYMTEAAVKARDLERRKADEARLAGRHTEIPTEQSSQDAALAILADLQAAYPEPATV